MITSTDYIARVKAYGQTDESYLQWHAQRFLLTKALFDQRHGQAGSCRILDIGAHWLHQSLLYALSGHSVIAADVGGVLNVQSVRDMAAEHDIALLQMGDLSAASVFDELEPDSIDFVLFTEILEHITFNPVGMWQAIHRVLKPGGKVIITTPNYYFWQSRAWGFGRFARRMGGGIPVHEIITQITYGHHWKEYSGREIVRYFDILPVSLYVDHMHYVSFNHAHRQRIPGFRSFCGRQLEQRIGFFRDSIYAEVAVYAAGD
ncbi:MAG: hypothetical protein Tsb0027_22420 [Wenzhouxiangellaceae bacterium]